MKFTKLASILLLGALAASCSEDPQTPPAVGETVEGATKADGGGYTGFYLLNQGNMGSNKATLDYFDYATCTYTRNVYAEANPTVAMELGDVGNDLLISDGLLFIVVNGSHKVEILDAYTAKRVAKVDVNSPRQIAVSGDMAYVTSFVGGDGDNGSVVAFSIKDFTLKGSVSVGIMPEGIAARDGKLYVANSGDYQNPDYSNYISVINAKSLETEYNIGSPINMQHIGFDAFGNLWASSRGNYADKASCLAYFYEHDGRYAQAGTVEQPVSNMAFGSDCLYYIGSTYDANWNATYSYGWLEPKADSYVPGNGSFIKAPEGLATPYALAVNPGNGDIYVTDVKNYVSTGTVDCFSSKGEFKWSAATGDIPAEIAFLK